MLSPQEAPPKWRLSLILYVSLKVAILVSASVQEWRCDLGTKVSEEVEVLCSAGSGIWALKPGFQDGLVLTA